MDDGDARPQVFVLALLGTSPGVVTELLWYLVHVERRHVVGLEVWTTSSSMEPSGSRALGERWPMFAQLTRALGEEATWLPRLPQRPQLDRPTDAPWDGEPFRVVAPTRGDGSELDDIRSPADAARFTGGLSERLAVLCAEKATTPPLVASLAGGRKTMSAGLQAAFSHHGRAGDRLVHLLLHPQLEAFLRKDRTMDTYGWPTPDWAAKSDVPMSEQVALYDVPIDLARATGGPSRGKPMVLGHPAVPRLRVTDDGSCVQIELSLGDRIDRLDVPRAVGLGYVAICGGTTDPDQIRRRIEERGAAPPASDGALRKALNRMASAIRDRDLGQRFSTFLPRQRDGRWVVEEGSSVVFLDTTSASAGRPARS